MLRCKLIYSLMVPCILVTGVFASINLNGDDITFRSYSNPDNTTLHYGDIQVTGGSKGMSRGKVICNSLQCYGTKNFVEPHPKDSTKAIKYTSIEAGEVLTVVRGFRRTSSGRAVIDLPEHFSLVTSSEGLLTVQLTPEGSPAILYVVKKSTSRLVVSMRSNDYFNYGDIGFSFTVTGVRKGYENEEVIIPRKDEE